MILRVMIIIASPQAMTRLTATICPFMRPRSRRSFKSSGVSMRGMLAWCRRAATHGG